MLATQTVREHFGNRTTKGEVGIEVEMEGRGLVTAFSKESPWVAKGDGSLRGEGVEYVLGKPCPRDQVPAVIKSLQDALAKSTLNPSDRCGIHVHVNVQELTLQQMVSFVSLFIIFEELLVKWCGEEREGNLFCLRAKDAEFLINRFSKMIEQGNFQFNDRFRYAAINLTALHRFGSLEFRSMRTDKDLNIINTWVEMLLAIKDEALRYDEPSEIVSALSLAGPELFLRRVMGPYAELLECPGMDMIIMDGVRRAQLVAYAEFPKEQKEKKGKPEKPREQVWQELARMAVDPEGPGRRRPRAQWAMPAPDVQPMRAPGEPIDDFVERLAQHQDAMRNAPPPPMPEPVAANDEDDDFDDIEEDEDDF